MRRWLSAATVAFLLVAASGCGSTEAGREAPPAAEHAPAQNASVPAPGDLAADALEAVADADSAHVDLDASLEVDPVNASAGANAGFAGGPITLHLEGDGSSDRGRADVRLDFGTRALAATLLADNHSLFVKFMRVWYGKTDIDLDANARERDLVTPDRVRSYFDDVFIGDVAEGPERDGQPTWRFEGHLNVDRLIELIERFQGDLHETELAQLEAFGEVTRLSFLVGKNDRLLYRFELEANLTHNFVMRLDEDPPVDSLRFHAVLQLSEFGKDVSFERPEAYAPLDELLGELLGGLE